MQNLAHAVLIAIIVQDFFDTGLKMQLYKKSASRTVARKVSQINEQ
jgi:hypothetical protein